MYISLIPFVILILLYYIGTSVAMNVIGDKSPPDADGLYVVGAAPAIVARCDKVNDDALQLPLSPNADPVIRVLIDRREIRVVEALVKSVGALQTLDSLPSLQNNETHVNSTSVSLPLRFSILPCCHSCRLDHPSFTSARPCLRKPYRIHTAMS